MFKKKDLLYECLKKHGQQYIYSYLGDAGSLLSLALCAKKYYLMVSPLLTVMGLDQDLGADGGKQRKKEGKNKRNKEKEGKKMEEVEQSLQIEKVYCSISKPKQPLNDGHWVRITQLPFKNRELQEKFTLGFHFFYRNTKTNRIVYLNRSLVDPNLNYNRGGFNSDMEDEMKTNLYSEMFDGEFNDIDFVTPEAIRARHKLMLEKIDRKKEEAIKLETIDYGQEFMKGVTAKKIAIILCFGGSFSIGIFQNGKCQMHKSDKKYVCRKKAGERQLNKDKQSGSQIQSMGSQIRRDQEKKHIANVYQILTDNRQAINSCDLVFLQAPGLNRLFIINDSETLSGVKDRLRSVCLTAKKANYTQVEAIYNEITKVCFIVEKQKTS